MLETGARREAINNGYADFNYNFTNILAKYYNANDSCRISVESLNLLNEAKIKIPKTVKESDFSRQTFRGSIEYKGIKGVKEQTPLQRVNGKFMFDHNPPVNIIKNKLLDVNKNVWNKSKTLNILEKYKSCVFMLTRDEDDRLKEEKTKINDKIVSLNSNMPSRWKWGDDAITRYKKCKIKISEEIMSFNTNKIPR
tara:strand:- start:85 stop:672 length:588 start_codon:yes stop_codon:yes gene_type:complete